MIKSFLHVLLPEDEYKRERMLYFLAEAAVITIIISLCIAISDYLFIHSSYEPIIPLFLIPFFIMIYTLFRYIFSGMEYTDVANEMVFKKQRKEKVVQSIVSGILFFILFNIFSGFPTSANEWYNVTGMSILFMVFLFLINYISLKSSYKKNKELED